MDAYTFERVQGERVRIVETLTSGELAANVRLYPPGGAFVEARAGCFFCATATIDVQLESTGLYTIIVQDNGSTDIGEYNVSIQKF